jgi:hypothetical protein
MAGIRSGTKTYPLSQIAKHKWNVLGEDRPLAAEALGVDT